MPIGSFILKLKGFKGKVILFANSYTNDLQYVKNCLTDFKKIDASLNVSMGLFNKDVKEHLKFLKNEEKENEII